MSKHRFSYHKSQIERNVKSCRLTNHFLDKDYKLIRDNSQKEFDKSLVKHLKIQIIDYVDFDQNLCTQEKETMCEVKEKVIGSTT